MQHAPQQVQYPHGDEAKLKFKDHDKEHPARFYLVCDFESFLVPSDEQSDPDIKTRIIDEHQVSGYCCYRVTDLPQHQTPPTVYSGPDVMTHFYDHVMSENREINKILSQQLPLSPMSTQQIQQHKAATPCTNCNGCFTHQHYKIKHHDHVTGEYLFLACNNCNLQLKPQKMQEHRRQ